VLVKKGGMVEKRVGPSERRRKSGSQEAMRGKREESRGHG